MFKFQLAAILISQYVVGQQFPKQNSPMPIASDIPFIVCDVCQKAAKTMYKAVKRKRDESAPIKLSEEDVLAIVEKSCDPGNPYGEWITKLDITESKDTLKLVEHSKSGRCQEECKTIQRACDDSIGDIDTDIGEILWRNELKLSTFINEACFQISNRCSQKQKKFKKGSRKDFMFVEMSEKEKEAMKLKESMKGIPGMPGMEMYSQEDMEAFKEQMAAKDSPDNNNHEGIINENESQNLSFFETLKQILFDFYAKVKIRLLDAYSTIANYVGYTKIEL